MQFQVQIVDCGICRCCGGVCHGHHNNPGDCGYAGGLGLASPDRVCHLCAAADHGDGVPLICTVQGTSPSPSLNNSMMELPSTSMTAKAV